jgi:quercetin dioxygenase-like cupin family protein
MLASEILSARIDRRSSSRESWLQRHQYIRQNGSIDMTANARTCHPGGSSKDLTRLPQLAGPLLQFNLFEELRQLRHEDSWPRATGRSSKTLAKYPDLRILLVLMKANTQINEHRAEGRVSIHALLGKICIHLPDQKLNLTVGQLLVLHCGMVHKAEALEESAFLLTVSWPKTQLEP